MSAELCGRIYKNNLTITWTDAKQACSHLDGDLVMPKTTDMFTSTKRMVDQAGIRVWIGMFRHSSGWNWSDGSPVAEHRWCPGEPNHPTMPVFGGLEVGKSCYWDTAGSNDEERAYICQKKKEMPW